VAQAEKIAQAAERCARIVRNFLTLARQHPPERQQVCLNQVIREALELLDYPLHVDTMELRLVLADDLPLLWADPHQLHQVVVNLVTNAHQAMRGTAPPRRLTVTTSFDPSGARVALEVADTGPGIPTEIQARIFEPFFTTKPVGVGTGLGLSFCQGIITTLQQGRILGTERFKDAIENVLARRVRPGKAGRPRQAPSPQRISNTTESFRTCV
jgi:C4-dicarboxylate-specific signal transduction histidine kinase